MPAYGGIKVAWLHRSVLMVVHAKLAHLKLIPLFINSLPLPWCFFPFILPTFSHHIQVAEEGEGCRRRVPPGGIQDTVQVWHLALILALAAWLSSGRVFQGLCHPWPALAASLEAVSKFNDVPLHEVQGGCPRSLLRMVSTT